MKLEYVQKRNRFRKFRALCVCVCVDAYVGVSVGVYVGIYVCVSVDVSVDVSVSVSVGVRILPKSLEFVESGVDRLQLLQAMLSSESKKRDDVLLMPLRYICQTTIL